MILIVTLIALLIERFFDWGHLRDWKWYFYIHNAIASKFSNLSPYIILCLQIIPFVFAVWLLQIAFTGMLYGFISLLFSLFIVIYCLGPRNLWVDIFSSLQSLEGDEQSAALKLQETFSIHETGFSAMHGRLLDSIFVETNRRVFAVLFWYILLGPVGAVLYRLINLCAKPSIIETSSARKEAYFLENLLDWVPVRLLTFLFALGGHFSQVITVWRGMLLLPPTGNHNELLLTECGEAALGVDASTPTTGALEKQAVSLLDRVFVMWMVLVAAVTLVF